MAALPFASGGLIPIRSTFDLAGEIIGSQDYTPQAWAKNPIISPIRAHENIQHTAVRVEKLMGL